MCEELGCCTAPTLQSLSQEAVRDEALEEAAKVCEDYFDGPDGAWGARQIAYKLSATLRALKREPNVAPAVGQFAHYDAPDPDRPAAAAPDVASILEKEHDGELWNRGVKELHGYPNLQAMLAGCVSGHHTEWPAIRTELIALLSKRGHGWVPSARFSWASNGMVTDPDGGYIWIDAPGVSDEQS